MTNKTPSSKKKKVANSNNDKLEERVAQLEGTIVNLSSKIHSQSLENTQLQSQIITNRHSLSNMIDYKITAIKPKSNKKQITYNIFLLAILVGVILWLVGLSLR